MLVPKELIGVSVFCMLKDTSQSGIVAEELYGISAPNTIWLELNCVLKEHDMERTAALRSGLIP
jgi:hypothetical protein